MGLSRLDNFLKSTRGTILYVDPNSLDSTDSIENSGNSLTRPFKTLQRALIESARFSYQRGLNNDRFNKTTILLYPGDHIVDNRPGYIPTGFGQYSRRSGETGIEDLTQWDLDTVFDLASPDNTLYKLNSVYGGVIIPRGTSIVGLDLRKTKIRPKYVPNPVNNNIERSCIFRTTGACYFWQFTILDANPNSVCYKDYTSSTFVPNFSHHKLAGFEYADGVNGVYINDDFLNGASKIDTTRTDLDMYYEKVAAVYGSSSGREISPDYDGSSVVDVQPVIDEYRIVGPKGDSVGITSIRSGDGGLSPSTTITVDLVETIEGLSVDSPIQISGIDSEGYDGQYVISSVLSDTQITYRVQNIPPDPLPGVTGSTLSLVVDTVTSASPYIFNISLRSVYGMCGLLADGDKATGFKSMVVAQYTGIGLQKDDNAFVKYNSTSGQYEKYPDVLNLHTNSRSRFKPEYENFHIKATNDSFLQLVSVFAIGYAQHFVTENGGDIALNNSNSNFGAKSLVSSGFKRDSFPQDDHGYITHIIPPKEIESADITVEFVPIDVAKTISVGNNSRLYLYNETNENNPPRVVIDGYHIGAKEDEQLSVQIYQSGIVTTYTSKVVMPYGSFDSTQWSSEKTVNVLRTGGVNSINTTTYKVTLAQPHSFINGETIRVIADNSHLPDGLQQNQIYHVSTVGITTDKEIYISKTLNDAINGNAIQINNKGGNLKIVSRVSDKNPGDIGHPVQWDAGGYWYINVDTTNNQIYDTVTSLGVSSLGDATTRTYVTRKTDSRSLIDTLYRVRYVLPKDSPSTARPPVDGFILQESGNIIGSGSDEISQLYNTSGTISNSTYLRNPRFIADISWSSDTVTVRSELPHNLKVGDQIEIVNVTPTDYNGTYAVSSIISTKEFTYSLGTNPGTFTNDTSSRDENLPYFIRKRYSKTYQVYRVEEIQPYVSNSQDGVYYLTLVNHSNYPTVDPFLEEGFAQPIENLYPQIDNDNLSSDPDASSCHAISGSIGEVVVNDPKNSITKETLESLIVGYGITDIKSTSGIAHTIYTSVDHGLSKITSVSIVSAGSNYGSTGGFTGILYNAKLVGATGTTGTNATAKITVNSGSITDVSIIDGGSAYAVGNTLNVVGVATTTGHVVGVVQVESILNNIEDTIKVTGISSETNSTYNTLYRVSGITAGKSKEINVISSETITNFSTTGLDSTFTLNAGYVPTGKSISISSLSYDSSSGIATVVFANSHGFKVDNKIRIGGANQSAFNGDFIVKKLNSLISLEVNVGVSVTTSTSATGTAYAYRPTLTSYAGDLVRDTESTSGRLIYEYDGITSTLVSSYSIVSTSAIEIADAVGLGFKLGDYLLIDDEIFRISSAVTSNSVQVFRAVLGSPRQLHASGSVIRKIKVLPVELRRNSIIRASGHTFEYLGFGPGNYSTSLPDKQDRVLTNIEKFLAQATKTDGGIVVYTGMNSDGDFFAGNKKINSATGKEETYDTPIPTNTGERNQSTLVNITDTQKLFVENSIKVEGGKDKNSLSEFDGPVIFNSKVTSNSDIEANSILIQGEQEVSRKISISEQLPTSAGNYGDVDFNTLPEEGEYAGWIYTVDNEWKPFGLIGDVSQIYGVGISSGGTYVGFSTLIDFVGTGLTITSTYDSINDITTLNFNVTAAPSEYANFAGIATYADFAGVATYAARAGFATYSDLAGISTNIRGGSASQIVYQSAPNVTSFIPNGLPGQVLHSNGTSIPYWNYVTTGTSIGANTILINSINGNSGDTSTYLALVGNNVAGLQTAFIDSDLSYNASTNALTATTFIGNLQGNATTSTTSTRSVNLQGGSASQIPYQTAANTTAFIPNGTAGQVLHSNGTGAPYWSNVTAAGSGVNIRSNGSPIGVAGTINFATGLSVSALSGGSVTITSTGGGSSLAVTDDGIPIGTPTTLNFGSGISAVSSGGGTITVAAISSGGGSSSSADTIRTQATSTSGTYYLTFVDSNNSSLSYESLYTDNGIYYNPAGDILTAGTYSGKLQYSVSAGDGLTGGTYNNTVSNVSLSLGTPSSISGTTTNSVSGTTHTHELADRSITASKMSGNQSGTAPVFGVRAWGICGGSGGGNVSSTSRNGATWTVNFQQPIPGAYAISLTIGSDRDHVCQVTTQSSSGFSFRTSDPGSGNNEGDPTGIVHFIVVG